MITTKTGKRGVRPAICDLSSYNSRGQLAEILAGSGISGNDSWNRGKLVNWYSLTCGGASCNAPDNNGNLMRQETYIPNNEQNTNATSWFQQYDYDNLNRLTKMREFNPGASLLWQQGYTIDRYGNRTIDQSNTSGGINYLQFNVDPNTNRLTVPAGYNGTMSYDNAGNLTTDTYSAAAVLRAYDAENRMKSETTWNSAVSGSYSYDGDGHRVKRIVGSTETWQVYGIGGELIAEYNVNGSPQNPLKEYGYRNGQLLVTTDSGTSSAPAPSALTATPPTSGASITLNWSAASGATNYRVERQGAGGSYTLVSTTSSTTLTDSTTTSGSAYLYKVCAANGSGNCTSGYSNIALGAAVTFPTDPTIKSYSEDPANATTPKAAHITELRTAINAVRILAGRSVITVPNPVIGDVIGVNNVRDLRAKLGEALMDLGIQLPAYTDTTLKGFSEDPLNATQIKAAHIRELRQAGTSGIGGNGGGGGSSFQIHWLVSDQLGTPRMIFDQSGSLATMSRHDYLPFGEELFAGIGGRTTPQGYSQTDGVRNRFTGKERDNETGLDYFDARYYTSTQGRFTSPDPIYFQKMMLIDPQIFNLYSYVRNNPMKLIDPSGMIAHISVNGNPNEAMDWFRTLAGDLANRLAFDPVKDKDGNVLYYNVTFNATAQEIGDNEGAKLVSNLVTSDKVFLAQAGGVVNAKFTGGKNKGKPLAIDVTKEGGGNVTRNRPGTQLEPADPNVDSIIYIPTSVYYVSNMTGEDVLPISDFIHEAAESYLLAQGIDYETAHGHYWSIPDRKGVFTSYPRDPRNAISRETAIREQLNLRGGRAGTLRQQIEPYDVSKKP